MTHVNETIETLLDRIDTNPEVIDAVMRLDAVTQHWRRKAVKRPLSRRAIETLGLSIEQSQLDVLFAIASPMDDADNETMVATVAERLSIDPSRASRIVAEMVNAGYARRAVSQADARRTIVELTEKGQAVIDAVQSYKWLMMADYLSGWSKTDIATFVPLLERYTDWFSDAAASEARLANQIAAIARTARTIDRQDRDTGRESAENR